MSETLAALLRESGFEQLAREAEDGQYRPPFHELLRYLRNIGTPPALLMALRIEQGECGPANDPRRLVAEQAEDEGLWFIAETAAEAYLQQELRRLHAAIEAATPTPPEGLVLARRDSGGVFPDGTTNTPAIDFDTALAATPTPPEIDGLRDALMDLVSLVSSERYGLLRRTTRDFIDAHTLESR